MDKFNKKSKVMRIIVLLFICSIFSSLFIFTGCAPKDFSDTFDTNIAANSRTYPYSESDAKVKSVSMDILYGTKKSLVQYRGEVPYDQTHEKIGEKTSTEVIKDFKDYYSVWKTSIYSDGANAPYAGFFSNINNAYVPIDAYWGKNIQTVLPTKDDKINKTDLENAINNRTNVTSLRLYALSNPTPEIILYIGNGVYMFFAGICQLAMMVLSLIVAAKNIEATTFLEAMHLEKANEIITQAFIWNKDTKSLSAFTMICIILFISTVVGFAISYAKGTQSKITKRDIAVYLIVGILLIGAALTGNLYKIGSTLSNISSKLLYAVACASTDSNAFKIDVENTKNENKLLQSQEMSLVNKSYIDIQICTQFNVGSIKDLDMQTLGDTNFAAANFLRGKSNNIDWDQEFDKNLGYYFWFADSGAIEKTKNNATIPTTNPTSAKFKLNSLITYLQILYNHGDASAKAKILSIMQGLVTPNTTAGFARMAILGVVIILLCLCLWRYAKDVLFAKVQMMVALLGLAIAGPLMITGKQKLVATAKDLVALIFISFIEITIHSLMFDAILYLISILLGPDFFSMVIPLILMILLFKFNKVLNEKIHAFTSNMESNMLSNNGIVHQAKRGISNWYTDKQSKVDEGIKWLQDRKRNVYDADGNKVGETAMFAGASGFVLGALANSRKKSSESESLLKIGSDAFHARKENKATAEAKAYEDAQKRVAAIQERINNNAIEANTMMTNAISGYVNEYKNNNKYTDEEKDIIAKRDAASIQKNALIKTRDKFVEDYAGKMDDAEYHARIKDFNDKINTLGQASTDWQNKLSASMNARATEQYYKEAGIDKDTQMFIKKYGQENGLKMKAQQDEKDNLDHALDNLIKEADHRSSTKLVSVDGKVNGKKKADAESLTEAQAARLMKEELKDGTLLVDAIEDARKYTKGAATAVSNSETFNINNDKGYVDATNQVHSAIHNRDESDVIGFHQTNQVIAGTAKRGVHFGKSTAVEAGKAVGRKAGRVIKHNNNATNINAAVAKANVDAIIKQKKAGTAVTGLDNNQLTSEISMARKAKTNNSSSTTSGSSGKK